MEVVTSGAQCKGVANRALCVTVQKNDIYGIACVTAGHSECSAGCSARNSRQVIALTS